MAEAATADIVMQLYRRIENRIEERENAMNRCTESVITIEAMDQISYRVAEQIYQEDTETAFVLLELKL
jgi:hypothetical protein